MFPETIEHPILFEEVFVTDKGDGGQQYLEQDILANPEKLPYKPNKITGVHLIFLAHGFGAIADHMKNIQYNIEVLFPDVMVVSSKINEDDTSISIAEMGLNLAKEVEQYIYMNCYKSLERLSFIGHSMGGVIIRAALPHLK